MYLVLHVQQQKVVFMNLALTANVLYSGRRKSEYHRVLQ